MLLYMVIIDSKAERSKFEKIYYQYRGLMYHIAYKILRSREDAEDAVHNAFIKIAENIHKIEEPVCPKTQRYIVIIVENKAIDLYRSNQRRNTVKYTDEITGVLPEPGSVQGLAACMEKLSPRYRQVILLKYHFGFTSKEIAAQLGITEANAIKLDQRAKEKLEKICKKEGIL